MAKRKRLRIKRQETATATPKTQKAVMPKKEKRNRGDN